MDGERPFRGFRENDIVKSSASVRNKLSIISDAVVKLGGERIRIRTPSAGSSTSSTGSGARPPNRFLRRSESLPSTSRRVTLDSNAGKSVGQQPCVELPMPKLFPATSRSTPKIENEQCSTRSNNIVLSNGAINIGTTKTQNNVAPISPIPPVLQVSGGKHNSKAEVEMPPRRVNKFLNTRSTPSSRPRPSFSSLLGKAETNKVKKLLTPTSSPAKNVINGTNASLPLENPPVEKAVKPGGGGGGDAIVSKTPEPQIADVQKPAKPEPQIVDVQKPAKPEPRIVDVQKPAKPEPKPPVAAANGNVKVEPKVEVVEPSKTDVKKIIKDSTMPLVETSPALAVTSANVNQAKKEPEVPDKKPKEIEVTHCPEKTPKKVPVPTSSSGKKSSTSELSFLNVQSSRSKRTIVPNKKFFPDSQPVPSSSLPVPVVKKEETKKTTPAKVASRKSVPPIPATSTLPAASEATPPKTKKRSISGDTPRKRKLSVESVQVGTNSNSPKIADGNANPEPSTTNSTTSGGADAIGGRPRRTIIPNKKFIDEEEPPKIPTPVKKPIEVSEPQRKRRKSEKAAAAQSPNPVKVELAKEKVINNIPQNCDDKPRLENGVKEKVKKQRETGAIKAAVFATKSTAVAAPAQTKPMNANVPPLSAAAPVQNGDSAKVNVVTNIEPLQNTPPTELSLTENEKKLFERNPLFLGTCILTSPDQSQIEAVKNEACDVLVFCGICSRLKKYHSASKKLIRGSFLCDDCVQIVDKIFNFTCTSQGAMYSCIIGPPICEGRCPLVFAPANQFCQACFAKACLINLPMEHGIYFKIWRCIPPIARGCVNYYPTENTASPNVGKVVIVTENGEISKMFKGEEFFGPQEVPKNDMGVSNGSDLSGSARINTFTPRSDSSHNCENSVPAPAKPNSTVEESQQSSQEIVANENNLIVKTTGVAKEELIFCSMCCEPYHPYCAGDDLLLDTYIAHSNGSRFNMPSPAEVSDSAAKSSTDVSKIVFKWNCRRCMSCKSCGESFSRKEVIRCSRCLNPYHLETCIDKPILNKFKDRAKLRKVWTCETCLKCKSCGKMIESGQRLRTIQMIAETVRDSSDEEISQEEGEEEEDCAVVSNHRSNSTMCNDCFKQTKKGSYCPVCEVCYDDNDWDCKMIECSKCQRWIHAACENLTDDEYNVLGKLPETIEYVCRLCHTSGVPLWYDAIQAQLIQDFNSVLLRFEEKVLGRTMRKRKSVDDTKPSFVRNLFGTPAEECNEPCGDDEPMAMDIDEDVKTPEMASSTSESPPRLRQSVRRKVTCKEIMNCQVVLRDFVKYPKTLEENWYALKAIGVEMLSVEWLQTKDENKEERIQQTPIYKTPVKLFTPRRQVNSIMNSLKGLTSAVKTVQAFQKLLKRQMIISCETEDERALLETQANLAIKETFPWVESTLEDISDDGLETLEDSINEIRNAESPSKYYASDPFKEVYWDYTDFFDNRCCALCGEVGDFPSDMCGRLLWCGVNEWIHCNCAIWSSEVYELENGALQQIAGALNRGKSLKCKLCNRKGATVSCCFNTCKSSYHFLCAIEAKCFLLEDKTMYCSHHNLSDAKKEKIQEDMKVGRKVFVDLDWIHRRGVRAYSDEISVFIGSLKIACLGNIVPISVFSKDELEPSETILIPKNFRTERIFWSIDNPCSKETYIFETGLSLDGFHRKSHDTGVNLVVNHEKSSTSVHTGLDNIKKYHSWLQTAPRFVDEDYVEWLTQCHEEFNVEPELDVCEMDCNVFASVRRGCHNGRSSPSSISSLGSSQQSSLASGHQDSQSRSYDFRRLPGRPNVPLHLEISASDGYASSLEDSPLEEIPKPVRPAKRRRSSLKAETDRILRRNRSSPKKKFDSPRRVSLKKNLRLRRDGKDLLLGLEMKGFTKMETESDNDSGVMDTVSSVTTESCDGSENVRLNLISRINESLVDEAFVSDTTSVSSSNFVSNTESSETNMEYSSSEKEEFLEKRVHHAAIQIEIRRSNSICCYHSREIKSAWMYLFDEVSKARLQIGMQPLVHPAVSEAISGYKRELENCFLMIGLSHRSVQFLIEQLPDVVKVVDRHTFRYSTKPFFDPAGSDYPLPVNSSGSARSEGFKGRKPFDMFAWLASRHRKVTIPSGIVEEAPRSQGLPLAMRFRDLGKRAKQRFVVLHSEIHGRGLFARCDIEKGDMLIEYAGEVIRHSLSDPRERYYESRGIGCYMFRIKTQVIDATLKGNAARFINHSCEPNCEAKTLRILGSDHIIIFALRKIFKGEELTYDYKFEREEEKIPCSCGAARCRKYMN